MERSKAFSAIEGNSFYKGAAIVSTFVLVGSIVTGIVDQFTKFPVALRISTGAAAGVLIAIYLLALLRSSRPGVSPELRESLGAVKIELLGIDSDIDKTIARGGRLDFFLNDRKFRDQMHVLSQDWSLHQVITDAYLCVDTVNGKIGTGGIPIEDLNNAKVSINEALNAINKTIAG